MCDDARGISRGIPVEALARVGLDAAALHQIVALLGNALTQAASDQDLVVVFEREVQRLLRMRAVRLREIPARYQVRLVTPTRTADSVVLAVPNSDVRVQAVLEAACDPNRDLDDRDYLILSSIAHLGGLVLEAHASAARRNPARDDARVDG